MTRTETLACACVHPDARECAVIRLKMPLGPLYGDLFPAFEFRDERCDCACHERYRDDPENELENPR